MRKVMRIAGLWLPRLLLALIFVPQGLAKFSDSSGWATAFRHWGYPDWFRVMIGVIELAGVACMALPRTAMLGALLIIAVMLGAMGTHLVLEHGRNMTSEVVPLTLAVIVLITSWRSQRKEAADTLQH